MVAMHQPKINLHKSPLSGSQITDADMRRRRYGEKCNKATRLSALFNDESHSLLLELWDARPRFEARGATLVCRWSGVLRHDKELCDLVMARIGRELAASRRESFSDAKAYCDHQRLLEQLLERVRSMKTEVIETALYGRKSA